MRRYETNRDEPRLTKTIRDKMRLGVISYNWTYPLLVRGSLRSKPPVISMIRCRVIFFYILVIIISPMEQAAADVHDL